MLLSDRLALQDQTVEIWLGTKEPPTLKMEFRGALCTKHGYILQVRQYVVHDSTGAKAPETATILLVTSTTSAEYGQADITNEVGNAVASVAFCGAKITKRSPDGILTVELFLPGRIELTLPMQMHR
jgi:hypothetical protein